MKTQQEIEQMLRDEIDNQNRINKLFIEAVERCDNFTDIQKIGNEGVKSTHRIIAFKEVLNHD